jgi:predicted HicB family RNase H-like nuclease
MGGGKGRSSIGKQFNFRAPTELQERLEATALALGLDISALVRLVLMENLHTYEQRAEEVRSHRPQPKTKE